MSDSILRSMSGTYGQVQVVAVPEQVLLDVSGRHYTTTGDLVRDHGLVTLDLDQALRLLALLQEAVEVAKLPRNEQLPKIWSERTIRHFAVRVGNRRHVHETRTRQIKRSEGVA